MPLQVLVFAVLAKLLRIAAGEQLPTFGDTINILGAMERTDQDFQDGLALDLFSPKNRTLVVQQNLNPLSGQFVSGTTGEGFMALQNYSYIIKMNETANDLIAKIEIPYDPDVLSQMGIQESNTYVGVLAADKQSWTIDDTTRNIHRSENNTRIIKMTSLDGEYILLGRPSTDTATIFVQYGQGATRTANITAPGRQEAEFVDGLRFSIVTDRNFTMNAALQNGIPPQSLPAGTVPVNSFAWVVNTSDPNANTTTTIHVPVNRAMVAALHSPECVESAPVMVARKGLGASNEEVFQIIPGDNQTVGTLEGSCVKIAGLSQIDGQYLLVTSA